MSQSPFDAAAGAYDEEFETSPATSRLRALVSSVVLEIVRPGDALLEINCGTGTDATALGKRGIRVVATDASPLMIAATLEKIHQNQVDDTVTAQVLPFDSFHLLEGRAFDAVLSNMGGLNCTADLGVVANDLAPLVRQGGHAVLCLISSFCLWETVSFLVRGKWKQAFRRRSGKAVTAFLHGNTVVVHYHSPSCVKRSFSPWFRHIETMGLNIFSPPPSSRRAYSLLNNKRRILERMDNLACRAYPFSHIGDHFLMIMERTNVPSR